MAPMMPFMPLDARAAGARIKRSRSATHKKRKTSPKKKAGAKRGCTHHVKAHSYTNKKGKVVRVKAHMAKNRKAPAHCATKKSKATKKRTVHRRKSPAKKRASYKPSSKSRQGVWTASGFKLRSPSKKGGWEEAPEMHMGGAEFDARVGGYYAPEPADYAADPRYGGYYAPEAVDPRYGGYVDQYAADPRYGGYAVDPRYGGYGCGYDPAAEAEMARYGGGELVDPAFGGGFDVAAPVDDTRFGGAKRRVHRRGYTRRDGTRVRATTAAAPLHHKRHRRH